MAKRNMTNEEKIVHMMNFSKLGGVKQAFLMEAIRIYSEQVIAAGAEAMNTPFISGAAWVGCAKECIEQLNTEMTVLCNDEEAA